MLKDIMPKMVVQKAKANNGLEVELISLKQQYESGLISEEEYKQQKIAILQKL